MGSDNITCINKRQTLSCVKESGHHFPCPPTAVKEHMAASTYNPAHTSDPKEQYIFKYSTLFSICKEPQTQSNVDIGNNNNSNELY